MIRCTVIYLNPLCPDPDVPPRLRADRWSVTAFDPLPLSSAELIKLASAVDPVNSALAVHTNVEGNLVIWGIVDQLNHALNFMTLEAGEACEPPGLFSVAINGPADVSVFHGFALLARLHQGVLVTRYYDVFQHHPVGKLLHQHIKRHISRAERRIGSRIQQQGADWRAWMADEWISTLRRVLIRAQAYHHGGSILIPAGDNLTDLNIKYPISYDRIPAALLRTAERRAVLYQAYRDIDEALSRDANCGVSETLHQTVMHFGQLLEESDRELTGCVSTVASLSKVDGAVLLDALLRVKGFGVEIKTDAVPPKVYLATDVHASAAALVPVDYNYFGTRHRSVMRYCFRHAGSIGFVVSQDGDVRAIIGNPEGIIMWDNIKLLHIHEESPSHHAS